LSRSRRPGPAPLDFDRAESVRIAVIIAL